MAAEAVQFRLQPAAEQELEFVAEDLASERVGTLDQALALIRQNVATPCPQAREERP